MGKERCYAKSYDTRLTARTIVPATLGILFFCKVTKATLIDQIDLRGNPIITATG